VIVLSSDLDWAPAWATTEMVRRVVAAGCEISIFVTHDGPELPELRESAGVELGWHPNFHPGSSHGETPGEVLDLLAGWVPHAKGVRAHGLVRSTALLEEYARRGLAYDSSDLMHRHPGLRPMPAWNGVVRIPIFWADDVEARHGGSYRLADVDVEDRGLQVFEFHPIHVALNTSTLAGYEGFKAHCEGRGITMNEAAEDEVLPFREAGRGTSDLLDELLDHLVARGPGAGRTLAAVAEGAEPL